MSPTPKVRMQVMGFGHVGLHGVKRVSGKQYICELSVQLVEEAGMEIIRKAIDEIDGLRLDSDKTHGNYTSATVVVEINTARKHDPDRYARDTASDLIGRIEARCLTSSPSARRGFKTARTPAQRGKTSASRKR